MKETKMCEFVRLWHFACVFACKEHDYVWICLNSVLLFDRKIATHRKNLIFLYFALTITHIHAHSHHSLVNRFAHALTPPWPFVLAHKMRPKNVSVAVSIASVWRANANDKRMNFAQVIPEKSSRCKIPTHSYAFENTKKSICFIFVSTVCIFFPISKWCNS